MVATLLMGACSDSQSSGDSGQDTEMLERGETLYMANCQACHGDRDGAGRASQAPHHNSQGHTWHHPDGQLLKMIFNGTPTLTEGLGLPPTTLKMPPFRERLTQEEVLAILSFIKTWWTEEQRDFQAELSRQWEEANGP